VFKKGGQDFLVKIFLDIEQKIVYIETNKYGCIESFFKRKRNPQRTLNSFFAGFFMKPRRVSYQDLTKADKNGKGGAGSKKRSGI
jgi:hypothetical protein